MKYDRVTRDRIKSRAAELRKKQTGAEYHLRAWLRRSHEMLIRRQVVVGKMIVDLGLPYRNLLIEVDGPSHNSLKEKDANRDAWLHSLGFNILRIKNDEVFNNPTDVLQRIHAFPENDSHRSQFQMSIRAARAKSFWIET